jgi:hypothetical protein
MSIDLDDYPFTWCDYCKDDDYPACKATNKHDKYEFQCTRDEGHTGKHVACGITDHELEVWDNEEG